MWRDCRRVDSKVSPCSFVYFGYEEEQLAMHPEMDDQNGKYINEELLSVRLFEERRR